MARTSTAAQSSQRRSLKILQDRLDQLQAEELEDIVNGRPTTDAGFMMNGIGSMAFRQYRDRANRQGEIARIEDAMKGGTGELSLRAGRSVTLDRNNRPMGESMIGLGDEAIGQRPKPKEPASNGAGSWGAAPPPNVGVSEEAARYYTEQAKMREAMASAKQAEAEAEATRIKSDPIEQRRLMLAAEGDQRRRMGMTGGSDMQFERDEQGNVVSAGNITRVPSPFAVEQEGAERQSIQALRQAMAAGRGKQQLEDEALMSPAGFVRQAFAVEKAQAPAQAAYAGRVETARLAAEAKIKAASIQAQGTARAQQIAGLWKEAQDVRFTLPPEQQDAAFAAIEAKVDALMGQAPVAPAGRGAAPPPQAAGGRGDSAGIRSFVR